MRPQRCETCALAKRWQDDRPLACLSKTGPMRGWYVEPDFGCHEWRSQEGKVES